MQFDGSDAKLAVHGIDLASQSFSWEFWSNRGFSNTDDFAFGMGPNTTNNNLHAGYLWNGTNTVFRFGFGDNDLDYISSDMDGLWHHWAGTYDYTTGIRTLYKDGLKVAFDPSPVAPYVGSGTFYMGAINHGTEGFYEGMLDEMRWWSDVRSITEIADNYRSQLTGAEDNLLASWDFDDIRNNAVVDRSPNNLHAVVRGNPLNTPLFLDKAHYIAAAPDVVTIDNINLSGQSFSVEFWSNRWSSGTNDWMVSQGSNGVDTSLHLGYETATGMFKFGFGSDDLTVASTDVDGWHHWAGTYDAASGVRTLYKDGVQVGTDVAGGNYIGSGTLNIGAYIDGTTDVMDGHVDEVRIWSDVRTAEEIRANRARELEGTEDNLLGYWNFDDDYGTTVNDLTPNNNDGTRPTGTYYASMKHQAPTRLPHLGRALDFDGSTSYAEVTYDATLNPTTVFTVGGWVRVDGGLATTRSVVTSRHDAPFSGYMLYAGANNLWQFAVGDGVGGYTTLDANGNGVDSDGSVQLNQWTHVAGVYDGTNMTLYINGEIAGVMASNFAANASQPLRIGAGLTESASPGYFFDGAIDQVSVWNTALDRAAIQDMMHNPLGGTESGLVGYWQADDTVAYHAIDKTGSGQDSTVVSHATSVLDSGHKGLMFETTTAPITVTNADGLVLGAADFTLETWVKTTGDMTLLWKGPSDGIWATGGKQFVISGGKASVGTYDTLNTDIVTSTATVADGLWHHIAYTYNASGAWTIYVDGRLETTATTTPNTADVAGHIVEMGRTITADGTFMDDVRIWNVARTAAEIAANMTLDLTGNETGLIGYWDFNKAATVTLLDQTANDNHAILNNAPTWVTTSPDITGTTFTTQRDTPISGTVSATDADNDTVTFGISTLPTNGTALFDSGTHTWTYTPAAGFAGTDSFVITADDGHTGITNQTITVDTRSPLMNGAIAPGRHTVQGLGGEAGYGNSVRSDLSGYDVGSATVNISNVFENGITFGSTTYDATSVSIDVDGYINLGSDTIAPFNHDLDISEVGNIYLDLDTANDIVTVTWADVPAWNTGNTPTNTFQLRLHRVDVSDFVAEYRYDTLGFFGTTPAGWSHDTASIASFTPTTTGSNFGHAGVYAWEFIGGSGTALPTLPDTEGPVFSHAIMPTSTSLIMYYGDNTLLDDTNLPAVGSFAVELNGTTSNVVTSVTVNASDQTVTLILTTPVSTSDTITVAYTDPTAGFDDNNAIQDTLGYDAASFSPTPVTNAIDVEGTTGTTETLAIGTSLTNDLFEAGDTDWFQVNLVAGTVYTFEMQGLASGSGTLADPYLDLMDNLGNTLNEANDDNYVNTDAGITYMAVSTGVHYLSAEASNGTDTGTYTLSAVETAGTNGTIATAQTIARSSFGIDTTNADLGDPTLPYVSIDGAIDHQGDLDFYAIPLEAGETLYLDIDYGQNAGVTPFDSQLYLYGASAVEPLSYLYDPLGTDPSDYLTYNDDADYTLDGGGGSVHGHDSYLSWTATSAETVYVNVRAFSGTIPAGDYVLNISLSDATGTGGGVPPVISEIDPLILDLDGDGIWLMPASEPSRHFAMSPDGLLRPDTWLNPGDGFLVMDRNHNGQIDDITEMFSEFFTATHTTGLGALSTLDLNRDHTMDARDVAFDQLAVWQDLNTDGHTDTGELRTLAEWGVTSLDLERHARHESLEGGTMLSQGRVTREGQDDSTFAEVAFQVHQASEQEATICATVNEQEIATHETTHETVGGDILFWDGIDQNLAHDGGAMRTVATPPSSTTLGNTVLETGDAAPLFSPDIRDLLDLSEDLTPFVVRACDVHEEGSVQETLDRAFDHGGTATHGGSLSFVDSTDLATLLYSATHPSLITDTDPILNVVT